MYLSLTKYPVGSGGGGGEATTNASDLTSGTLADARLSANVPLLDEDNSFAGDLEVTDLTKGIILKSPDGTRWRITVEDDGSLTTTEL